MNLEQYTSACMDVDQACTRLSNLGHWELANALRAVLDADANSLDAPDTSERGAYIRIYNAAHQEYYG